MKLSRFTYNYFHFCTQRCQITAMRYVQLYLRMLKKIILRLKIARILHVQCRFGLKNVNKPLHKKTLILFSETLITITIRTYKERWKSLYLLQYQHVLAIESLQYRCHRVSKKIWQCYCKYMSWKVQFTHFTL